MSLVWLIPACAARLIKEAMKTKQPNFKKMNIQELIVNGEVLFQVMGFIFRVDGETACKISSKMDAIEVGPQEMYSNLEYRTWCSEVTLM